MTGRRQWSIRAKSVALVGGYLLALCGVYGAFTVYLLRREATQAHERFQQTAQIVAAELDAYLQAGRQRLATVSRLPGMAYGLSEMQEAQGDRYIPPWTTLHYLFFRSPVFTGGVFLLDRAGKVLWTEPPGLSWLGHNLAEYSPIAALRQRRQIIVSDRQEANGMFDRPHVIIGAPIQNASKELDGVLGGVIELDAPEFTNILRATSTAEGRFVDIVDQHGMVLASTDTTRRLRESAGVTQTGEPLMLATSALTQAPWHVTAGQPRAVGLASVRQFQWALWGLGALLLLGAIAVGAPFVNGFVRAVQGLTDAADVMARGDLSQPVAVPQRRDELATLARTFEQMRIEIERSRLALEQRLEEREELIQLKEEFLANTSHELRTPLHVIMGYTEMLGDEEMSADARAMLNTVRTQSDHLLQLLTDLMSLSSLNTGKMAVQVSPVRVPHLLSRLTPLVEQLRQDRDIEVSWECAPSLPTIETDALRLEQTLSNLITNAFKFTSKGSVKIRAYHDAEQVCFEVSDTGIGIPAHELPHIFDEFRQVNSSVNRLYGGVGLGLALVRRLATLLHGEVNVVSELGRGSTFTLALPVHFVGPSDVQPS